MALPIVHADSCRCVIDQSCRCVIDQSRRCVIDQSCRCVIDQSRRCVIDQSRRCVIGPAQNDAINIDFVVDLAQSYHVDLGQRGASLGTGLVDDLVVGDRPTAFDAVVVASFPLPYLPLCLIPPQQLVAAYPQLAVAVSGSDGVIHAYAVGDGDGWRLPDDLASLPEQLPVIELAADAHPFAALNRAGDAAASVVVADIAPSPDGTLLAVGFDDGRVQVGYVDALAAGSPPQSGWIDGPVSALSFSRPPLSPGDAALLAAAHPDVADHIAALAATAPDLYLVAGGSAGSVTVFPHPLVTLDARFPLALPPLHEYNSITGLGFADLTASGVNELVVSTYEKELWVYSVSGSAVAGDLDFELASRLRLSRPVLSFAFVDLSADGSPEFVVVTRAAVHVFVHLPRVGAGAGPAEDAPASES
ncbi:uncharacterized protein AMSG_10961 [Thecamonas trahens ATCC 50062]|uniref:Uncharacterized protein n=1 Tax=Thecamonas trahens ATCC 50062 TaxID=461836 RepID=A0A0L0DTD4_THETB|nr:hypothetical protein AMSG_10961 [Thecamonas trahens ATCC 50062]KNC55316.1 hypothetical protein AMSG_10961 [Thecamonas trahens ATCC 50062]|eukprot:XP_013753039.1 hypothetical protein AMSG_10961 [Thecamonas trahens ATCC 50062]